MQIKETLYSGVYLLGAATLALLIGGGIPTLASTYDGATPSNATYAVALTNDIEETDVLDTSDISFNIRIPAQVVLSKDYDNGGYSGTYRIYAENNNSSEDCIEVYPATRTLELSTTGKEPVTAYIEQEDTVFDSSVSEAEGRVYVDGELSAGQWKGKFEFNISPIEVEEVTTFNLLNRGTEVATPSNAIIVTDEDITKNTTDELIESSNEEPTIMESEPIQESQETDFVETDSAEPEMSEPIIIIESNTEDDLDESSGEENDQDLQPEDSLENLVEPETMEDENTVESDVEETIESTEETTSQIESESITESEESVESTEQTETEPIEETTSEEPEVGIASDSNATDNV